MRKVHIGRRGLLIAPAAVCLALGLSPETQAFSFGSGDWTGSWDTTLGYGQGWRVEGRNCALIAIADGGCGYGPNVDDGDLNYGQGTFTEALTGITEFSLKYKDTAGVFVRGSGLYDFYVMGNNTERTPLSHDAKDIVGSYTRLLDAFGYARFNLGSMPSELRLGRQVVDWGESLYIIGGLNQVDYFDVTALQVPGAELKQALLPDESAILNLQLTKNLSTQLIYLVDWHPDIIEPDGSYFSTNDVAGAGGSKVVLGFGGISDQGVNFTPLGGSLISNFQAIPRGPDDKPPESGQYGVNFKLFLPNLGQGTQLGFYFLNYTSRLPVLSVQTGTQAGFGNAFGAAEAVGAAAQAIAAGVPVPAAIATGSAVGQQAAAAAGGNLSAATATQYATIGANTLLAGGNVSNQASSLAANEYAHSQSVFEQFPQDIKMLGLSFNSEIQATGTSIQGEVAFRHNVPLQLDVPELIYASLSPFETGLNQLLGNPVTGPGHCVPGSATPITGCNQFGLYGLGQTVQGYELKNMWHFDVSATQFWANVFNASRAVLTVEAGADYVPSLENKYTGGPEGFGVRFDSSAGTNLSGNPNLGGYPEFPAVNGLCVPIGVPGGLGQCVEPGSEFATSFAWGYVVAGHLEYANVIGAWNLTPHVTWSQDVSGNSPAPGGAFVAGRYAGTVGVTAGLRNMWELDVSFTHYGGAGQYNLLGDRDFVAASVKFSF
ncbi:MAG TPA: DUF1302 domain-containing protein [Steroidobacteraceae bacterium]|nr:DUF1302 domain-containing protein [Steroidobacteraceae bacterium]